MATETFTSHALTLTVSEDQATVLVSWRGRSTAREPAEFLIPILTKALNELEALPTQELLRRRHERLRKLATFVDGE